MLFLNIIIYFQKLFLLRCYHTCCKFARCLPFSIFLAWRAQWCDSPSLILFLDFFFNFFFLFQVIFFIACRLASWSIDKGILRYLPPGTMPRHCDFPARLTVDSFSRFTDLSASTTVLWISSDMDPGKGRTRKERVRSVHQGKNWECFSCYRATVTLLNGTLKFRSERVS